MAAKALGEWCNLDEADIRKAIVRQRKDALIDEGTSKSSMRGQKRWQAARTPNVGARFRATGPRSCAAFGARGLPPLSPGRVWKVVSNNDLHAYALACRVRTDNPQPTTSRGLEIIGSHSRRRVFPSQPRLWTFASFAKLSPRRDACLRLRRPPQPRIFQSCFRVRPAP